MTRLWDGASIVALGQQSYDSRGRLVCSAVRMNPATFSSPPASACDAGTEGPFGPDRITRNEYDAAGQVTAVWSAYGTPLAQKTAAYTYTPNGQVATLTDARNFRTTYEYDGLDRLDKRRYPHPTSTHQSSTTDFEQFHYDAGRLSGERRRSGHTFSFAYDDLGRITERDAPGTQPDIAYAYDLLDRVTSVTQTGGHTLTAEYDALSRLVKEQSGELGTVTYEYDAAGRRTKMIVSVSPTPS